VWSKKAIAEAKRYGTVNIVASSEPDGFNRIPGLDPSEFSRDADYFHITINNTIYGTRFTELPDTGEVPLVTDASSSILSQVYDVSKFGLIYAGAQKNIGPAGLTIVIIREDLIGRTMDFTPTMLNYKIHADNDSMYNTPPTFAIYMAMLVFQWLKRQGGVPAIEKLNIEKAKLLYDFIDNSSLFRGTVVPRDRSLMNVPFLLPTEELNKKFIKEAEKAGLVNLAGHRSVGGMRASIYNPMPLEGVKALVRFMEKFELENK
jgi:phosphoserine aminotransferase